MSPLLIAGNLTPPNVSLLDACRRLGVQVRLLPPGLAARRAWPNEVVLGRVDVRPTMDGVEPGLEALRRLEDAGSIVLNGADALLAAHDKLETAKRLRQAGLPHPQTVHVAPGADPPRFGRPVVLKPRFGSWGTDVVRCGSPREYARTFSRLSKRAWFESDGVLVQELLPPPGADLRVIVSAGVVVGAISRVAAPGEWRTNVALGGTRQRTRASGEAKKLAIAAAAAIGADLVGVDLLPTPDGYVVLEVNGCVDFTADYSLPAGDVFEEAVESLLFPHIAELADLSPVPT